MELEFVKFNLHMIYGFKIKPQENFRNWFEENYPHRVRSGWVPMYFPSTTPADVRQKPLPQFSFEWEALPAKGRWKSSISLKGDLCSFITLRIDGAGALTFRFVIDGKKENQFYNTEDILKMQMLVPRSAKPNNKSGELTKLNKTHIDCPDCTTDKFKESWVNFSDPFKLFVDEIFKLEKSSHGAISWEEFETVGQEREQKKSFPTFYMNQKFSFDPQIPYMCVTAELPFDLYKQAFLEGLVDQGVQNEVRKKFVREIASILGRWIVADNIQYASTDYWLEQNMISNDGSFYNKYMNSLLFATYSDFVTILFMPNITDQMKKLEPSYKHMTLPVIPTQNSLLRCLEFSRMRWHLALWLNRMLDELIQDASKKMLTSRFVRILDRLIELRKQAAVNFEDPLIYTWDSEVGNFVAQFLLSNVVENLEKNVIEKLDMTQKIINDNLTLLKTKEYIDILTQEKLKK